MGEIKQGLKSEMKAGLGVLQELLPGSDSDAGVLLTVEELAARLRVKPSWVYSHADDVGAYRLGKYLRFSWDRVMERLNKARIPA